MKIAIVNDHFSIGPGGQHRIQNIAQGFSKLGHDVTYISPYGISKSISETEGLNFASPNSGAFGSYVLPYFNDFFKVFKMLSKLQITSDFLIIELPNSMSKSLNISYSLIKNIATSFDFGGLWTSIFDKGKIYGSSSPQVRLSRPISQLYEDSLALLSSPFPNLLTVPTTGMKSLFEKFFGRSAAMIYQPVDTSTALNPSLINTNSALELIPDKYRNSRLVTIGVKGDEWFAPFLEKLVQKCKGNDVVFMVIGHFPKAEEICAKKGLSNHVYFTGNIPYPILPHYIALTQFSIVLTHPNLASVWYAPHNIAKIADYMAMGKPVITDTIAAIDYVENEKTGFLERTDKNLLNKALCLLNDDLLAQKIGENARKKACEDFDNVKVASSYLRLIKQAGVHASKGL